MEGRVYMFSIAVCDDELLFGARLSEKIRSIMERLGRPCVVRQFQSGKELLEEVEQFDLIFLDILMKDINGMDTARVIRDKEIDKLLIFISSSRDHVWESYDVEAFWYLVKPVSESKLERVLHRAVAKMESEPQEYLIIQKERRPRKVFLKDIFYCEIQGRIIEIHGKEGNLPYYGKIGELEKQLCQKGFYRCHKSLLVNLELIDTYNRQEIVLTNGERLPIARRRYEEFCQALLEDMKKRGGIW